LQTSHCRCLPTARPPGLRARAAAQPDLARLRERHELDRSADAQARDDAVEPERHRGPARDRERLDLEVIVVVGVDKLGVAARRVPDDAMRRFSHGGAASSRARGTPCGARSRSARRRSPAPCGRRGRCRGAPGLPGRAAGRREAPLRRWRVPPQAPAPGRGVATSEIVMSVRPARAGSTSCV